MSGSGPFNLSHDDQLVAFQDANDLMVRDLARGVTTRVVQGPGVLEPILSPEGRRVAYSTIVPPQMGIAIRPTAGGPADVVFTSSDVTLVEDWSRDGRFLLGIQTSGQQTPSRGLIIPLEGNRTPLVFADLPTGSGLDEPRFSYDGKWVVYNAADSGRQQVYLTPVPPTGERWQLSTDGGAQGRWRSDTAPCSIVCVGTAHGGARDQGAPTPDWPATSSLRDRSGNGVQHRSVPTRCRRDAIPAATPARQRGWRRAAGDRQLADAAEPGLPTVGVRASRVMRPVSVASRAMSLRRIA